jgi:hypothetical protein
MPAIGRFVSAQAYVFTTVFVVFSILFTIAQTLDVCIGVRGGTCQSVDNPFAAASVLAGMAVFASMCRTAALHFVTREGAVTEQAGNGMLTSAKPGHGRTIIAAIVTLSLGLLVLLALFEATQA